jgi:SAM-dependent methyltransferase
LDEVAKYLQDRWAALAAANALFTRPKFDLDPESAKQYLDPQGLLGEVDGKDVLCLASGGGQQSAAFAMLGANVTVLDISDEQVHRDRLVAEHYGLRVTAVQGDMRDLSRFGTASFDIVYHAYSINFVPDAVGVFRGVARVMRPGGRYNVGCANPFSMGLQQADWNGSGYTLRYPYVDGAKISYDDQDWVYSKDGKTDVPRPVEYRHTLSTILNGLAECGFVIVHASDSTDMQPDLEEEPGTWDHQVAYAPPWLTFWAVYRPDLGIE